MEGKKSYLDETEDQISDLEEKVEENAPSEQQKEKNNNIKEMRIV